MTEFALAHPWLFTIIAVVAILAADRVLTSWALAFGARGQQ